MSLYTWWRKRWFPIVLPPSAGSYGAMTASVLCFKLQAHIFKWWTSKKWMTAQSTVWRPFFQSSDSQLILLHSGLRIFLLWFNERCQLCRVSLFLTQQFERREFLGTNTNKLGAYTIVHKGYQKNSPANKRNRNLWTHESGGFSSCFFVHITHRT